MFESTLNYDDYDLVVMCKRKNDCIIVPQNQLPNGKLPNGKKQMFKDGNVYKIEIIDKKHIISFIISFLLILIAIFIIIYSSTHDVEEINNEIEFITNF